MYKIAKLNNSQLSDLIWKKGFFKKGKILSVKYIFHDGTNNRLIIAVSSKIFSKAVDRNKARRQIKAIASKYSNKLSNSIAMMIFFNKNIDKPNFQQLEDDYQNIINQI